MSNRSELNSGEKNVNKLIRQFSEPITLSTGIKVKINVAPAMLVEQAVSRVKFPDVPVQVLEDGRKVENPNHPEYLQARQDAIRNQSQASLDVMIAFIDLVDPIEDDTWIKRLNYLVRLGHADISGYDLDDELDREFVYKKYIAIGNEDAKIIALANGISGEDLQSAKDTFPGTSQ